MKVIFIIAIILSNFFSLTAQNASGNISTANVYNFTSQIRTVHPLLQRANQKIGITEFEDVFAIFDNAVAQNPNSVEALLSRARYKNSIGMTTEANVDINLANKINPYLVNLYGFNGSGGLLSLMAIDSEQTAVVKSKEEKIVGYSKFLKKSLHKKFFNPSMRDIYAPIILLMEEGRYAEALEAVDILAETEVHNPVIYDLRGNLLNYLGENDSAVDAFILATSIEPKFYVSWYNLGIAEKRLGMKEKAMEHLVKSIEVQSEFAPAYLERASIYNELGNYKAAIEDYTKVIALQGDGYAEAHLNRGLAKMAIGDYSGAVVDLNIIIDEFPDNEQLRFNRGNLNLILGNLTEAYNDFTSAIELKRDYAEAYYNRGIAGKLMYNEASACEDFMNSQLLGYEKAGTILPYFCNN